MPHFRHKDQKPSGGASKNGESTLGYGYLG